jgi:hypothetical protein
MEVGGRKHTTSYKKVPMLAGLLESLFNKHLRQTFYITHCVPLLLLSFSAYSLALPKEKSKY